MSGIAKYQLTVLIGTTYPADWYNVMGDFVKKYGMIKAVMNYKLIM